MTPTLIERAFADAVRTDLDRPGFALLDYGPSLDPAGFRAALLGLADALDGLYRGRHAGRRLRVRQVDRFDQQNTTLPHLDGGPDESLLVLGYEPTGVASRFGVIDYSKAADERGLAPREFLARFNPIVPANRALLAAYATDVRPFDAGHYRVVVVNNGSAATDRRGTGFVGVLHTAEVLTPDPAKSRWIDSLMLESAAAGDPERVPAGARRAYVAEGTPFAGGGV